MTLKSLNTRYVKLICIQYEETAVGNNYTQVIFQVILIFHPNVHWY